MGVPLNLKDIQSGFLSASAFNANNTLTEQALAKALNRTGSSDNAMEVDLDMGLNNINNLAQALSEQQAVPLSQLKAILRASTDQVTSTADREFFSATAGQSVFTLSTIEYVVGADSLLVFVNGVYQTSGLNYLEINPTTIEFTLPLEEFDTVTVIGARFDAGQFFAQTAEFKTDAENAATAAEDSATTAASSATDAEGFATDAQDAAGYKLDVNNQTGVTYTLVIEDEGDFVRMDNALENTVTVPNNNNVAFEVGTIILLRQVGEGTTVVNPGLGVTVNAPFDNYEISSTDFGVALVKVAEDEWDLIKAFGGVDTSELETFNTEFDARLQDFYTELLSSDPTFVVNFDSLRNDTEGAISTIQSNFSTLESNLTDSVTDFQDTITQDFDDLNTQVNDRLDDLGLNGGFESSLTDVGYQYLPNGFIMQWGFGTLGGGLPGPAETVTFPVPFPNSCFNVTSTYLSSTNRDGDNMYLNGPASATSFRLTHMGNNNANFYWSAVGH
jgi:hypothetical protein